MECYREELMYIDGKEVESVTGRWIEVENPSHRGKLAGKAPKGGAQDVDLAVKAAQKAFYAWSRMNPRDRGDLLRKVGDELEKHVEEVAYTIASENGNAVRTQARNEAKSAVLRYRYYGGLAYEIKGTTYPGPENLLLYSRREPIGVVAGIVPWNAPVGLTVAKVGAALVTGNTMVLKVASDAPLAAMYVAKTAAKMLPPGVLNVVSGSGGECGTALLRHPGVGKVSFTGSTEVGKEVMKEAAPRILKSTMELGGKNPVIVFPDCDVEETAKGLLPGARITRQGQSCSSGSRVYIHKSIFDKVVAALAENMKALKVGDACDEASDLGAISSKVQFDKICGFLETALKEDGVKLVCGGLPPKEGPLTEGYHLIPTVFTSVNPDSLLVRKELFGPIIVCVPWEDEEEVIRMANDTLYGLTAFIWSKNTSKAIKMANEIKAGWIIINSGGGQQQGHPYGGMKESGIGKEHSLEGMLESYTELKGIIINLDYGTK
jgi:betaine-aldehyde dehydrogenase